MHRRMEHSFVQQNNQQPCVVLGWTQQSAVPRETAEAPSHSASSAVISPPSRDSRDTPTESSGQSSSSLKERDYIGLADVSSAPSADEADDTAELNLSETDLRLGLGPVTQATAVGNDKVPDSQKSEGLERISNRASCVAMSRKQDTSDVAFHTREDATVPNSAPSTWQSIPMNCLADVIPISHLNALVSASKNGGKRMYAEAMVDASRDSGFNMNVNAPSATVDLRLCANPVMPTKQFQEQDGKSYAVHSQGGFWVPSNVPSWQPHAKYGSVSSQKSMAFSSTAGDRDVEVVRSAVLDATYRIESSRVQSVPDEENVPDEAPPAKGQVVGWPPVRSYRRSTLTMRSKLNGDEGESQSAIYVKVNMDGIPIGRKVDLNAYKSYDTLLSALEDMFHNLNSGLGARFLNGSEFVLTYEDKEGDWMLVGDVPWGMFVNAVRRLRITRGSDMSGLGSRTPCHA